MPRKRTLKIEGNRMSFFASPPPLSPPPASLLHLNRYRITAPSIRTERVGIPLQVAGDIPLPQPRPGFQGRSVVNLGRLLLASLIVCLEVVPLAQRRFWRDLIRLLSTTKPRSDGLFCTAKSLPPRAALAGLT